MLEYETIRMTCSARDTWCRPPGVRSAWEGNAGDARLTPGRKGHGGVAGSRMSRRRPTTHDRGKAGSRVSSCSQQGWLGCATLPISWRAGTRMYSWGYIPGMELHM